MRNTKRNGAFIYMFESEHNIMVEETKRFPNTETGGDLWGTLTHGEIPVIWFASLPGKGAMRTPTSFRQDIDYLNKLQNIFLERFALQYVGSWHSHHQLNLDEPSHGDLQNMEAYARKHNRKIGLEIVVTIDRSGRAIPGAFYYPDAQYATRVGWLRADIKILSGKSPVSERLEVENFDYFRPKTLQQRTQSYTDYNRRHPKNTSVYENYSNTPIQNSGLSHKAPDSLIDEINRLTKIDVRCDYKLLEKKVHMLTILLNPQTNLIIVLNSTFR